MLETRALTRTFGVRTVVDDVSLTVAPGEIVGFVGANGAGKTTTMRMIMGVLAPTGGRVDWQGSPATAADRARFGYMPEERGLYPKQPVMGQLAYLGQLHGLAPAEATRSAGTLLERLGLAERGKDKLETLSLGNQQRVQIAAALLGRPQLLVLDEPFSGLDPTAVDDMAALLVEHAANGCGVLFSSHQLDLVERCSDRLVVLAHGRVTASGTLGELRGRGPVRYRVRADSDFTWLATLGWAQVHSATSEDTVGGATAIVSLLDGEPVDRLIREAVQHCQVYEVAELTPSLTEIFREVAA